MVRPREVYNLHFSLFYSTLRLILTKLAGRVLEPSKQSCEQTQRLTGSRGRFQQSIMMGVQCIEDLD
mgnify:FL=1